MFGLGWNELLVVGILAVVVVGPERLPEMMKFLGRQYGKLRRASDELRRAFMFEADKVDQERRLEELRKRREEARKRAEAIRKRALESRGQQPDLSDMDPSTDVCITTGAAPASDDGSSAAPSDGASAAPSAAPSAVPEVAE
jgi:sec-independent protein translocase protein TatB